MNIYFIDENNTRITPIEEWGLHCSLKKITLPTAKTNFIEIPGRNGAIDATEVDGKVFFNDRLFTLEFEKISRNAAEALQVGSSFAQALHGKRVKMFIENDNYYFDARLSVDAFEKKELQTKITVNVTSYPYMLAVNNTVVSVVGTGEEQTVTLNNGSMAVVPTVLATDQCTLTFETTAATITTTIPANTEMQVAGFYLSAGDNEVTVTCNGNVTFTYRQGVL